MGNHGERAGVETFHVAGAAPVEATVDFPQTEWVASPGLASDRHDIRVTGEDDAAIDERPDGRQKRYLVAGGVGQPAGFDPEPQQILIHVIRQFEIRLVAHGRESHQLLEQRPGVCDPIAVHRPSLTGKCEAAASLEFRGVGRKRGSG